MPHGSQVYNSQINIPMPSGSAVPKDSAAQKISRKGTVLELCTCGHSWIDHCCRLDDSERKVCMGGHCKCDNFISSL
jgi:hypothetical protein